MFKCRLNLVCLAFKTAKIFMFIQTDKITWLKRLRYRSRIYIYTSSSLSTFACFLFNKPGIPSFDPFQWSKSIKTCKLRMLNAIINEILMSMFVFSVCEGRKKSCTVAETAKERTHET